MDEEIKHEIGVGQETGDMIMEGKIDLGIKIGSKEEAKWREIIAREEEQVLGTKINLEMMENNLAFATKRADEEQRLFRKV